MEKIYCKNCKLSKEDIENRVSGRAGCPNGEHNWKYHKNIENTEYEYCPNCRKVRPPQTESEEVEPSNELAYKGCEICENNEGHGHCLECGLETTPVMKCKCDFRNHLPPQTEEDKCGIVKLGGEFPLCCGLHRKRAILDEKYGKSRLEEVLHSKEDLGENIDNFIRDICSVVPKSKSEVRERLNKIVSSNTERVKLEADKIITQLLREFANTPLNTRQSGWDWLLKTRDIINNIK